MRQLKMSVLALALPLLMVSSLSQAAVDNERVQAAIQKGVAYLKAQQQKDGKWLSGSHFLKKHPLGSTAVATYALLSCGESANSEHIKKAFAQLIDERGYPKTKRVYTLGLLASALHLAAIENKSYEKPLRNLSSALIRYHAKGAYGYEIPWKPNDKHNPLHVSTSQYGILGVWAGMSANPVSSSYWLAANRWWKANQVSDGGWPYRKGGKSTASMTVAGIASSFLCFDNLYRNQFVTCTGGKLPVHIQKGMDWMAKHAKGSIGNPGSHWNYYYSLYGFERVGLAAGYKYFGTCDWYADGVDRLLPMQWANGGWPDIGGKKAPKCESIVNTSFALIFLLRGQQPVLMNKLEFQGDWNNRPRDLANVTAWMNQIFEQKGRWQITNLLVPVEELHDSRILYMSGCKKLELSDADIAKLRTYVLQGGTILSCAECNGVVYKQSFRAACEKLFPEWKLKLVDTDSPIYTSLFQLNKDKTAPELYMVHNGVRPLVIYSDEDFARSWQTLIPHTKPEKITRGGMVKILPNIMRHIVGRMEDLESAGSFRWPAATKLAPTIHVAHVKYAGNWNPEPLAYERFSLLMAEREKVLPQIEECPAASLASSKAKVAIMAITEAVSLSSEEQKGLKAFLAKGGLLFVDTAGGDAKVAEAGKVFIRDLTGEAPAYLSSRHALYQIKGKKITEVYDRKSSKAFAPGRMMCVLKDKKLSVLFSPQDITGGLLGMSSGTIRGYDPESAYDLMRNIILHGHGRTTKVKVKTETPVAEPDKKEAAAKAAA